MTETLLAALSDWGVPTLGLVTFLSCLALPVPSSLVMLAAGALAAVGELSLAAVALAALAGAVLGDQAGYLLGRGALAGLVPALARHPARAQLLVRAETALVRRGLTAVFLSRWLFSPLGPYVNLLAGTARLDWGRFTLAAIAGEVVWVAVYVGLGALFADRFQWLAGVLGNAVGLATSALIAALALGLLLRRGPASRPRRPRS